VILDPDIEIRAPKGSPNRGGANETGRPASKQGMEIS